MRLNRLEEEKGTIRESREAQRRERERGREKDGEKINKMINVLTINCELNAINNNHFFRSGADSAWAI